MYRGYVKVWRKIYDNPLSKKPEYLSVWLYLFSHANHEDKEFIFNNKKQTIKRGQILIGRKKISSETGINESNVQRILKYLENEHQIEQQTFSVNRIITVVNYDLYQKSEQHNEQPANNQRTTNEQPANTTNTLKAFKVTKKNEKNNKYIRPSNICNIPDEDNYVKQLFPQVSIVKLLKKDYDDLCKSYTTTDRDGKKLIDNKICDIENYCQSHGYFNKYKNFRATIIMWIRRE